MKKERHLWKSRHIPEFPPRKCPVFQYHVTWFTRRNGNRLVIEKQIMLPKWKFSARSLAGEKFEEFVDWCIESLEHEDIHQVTHELEGFEVSEMLD